MRCGRSDYLGGMLHLVDGKSELYLDDALPPILIITWIGPATLDLVDRFTRWADEQVATAKRSKRPLIMVHDATAADRPGAEVRRAFAEQRVDPTVSTRTIVVLTNPLVRGAMTAIGWLVGESFDVVSTKTMADALTQAAAYARSHGLVPPSDGELARYAERSLGRSA
jgi:hypothetical protein